MNQTSSLQCVYVFYYMPLSLCQGYTFLLLLIIQTRFVKYFNLHIFSLYFSCLPPCLICRRIYLQAQMSVISGDGQSHERNHCFPTIPLAVLPPPYSPCGFAARSLEPQQSLTRLFLSISLSPKLSHFCGNPVCLTTRTIPHLRESHKKFVFVEDWNLLSLYGK